MSANDWKAPAVIDPERATQVGQPGQVERIIAVTTASAAIPLSPAIVLSAAGTDAEHRA